MPATKRTAVDRLHVLILDPSFHCGERPGPARTFAICRELVQSGYHVTVLTTSSDPPSDNDGGGITILNTGAGVQTRFGYPVTARANRSYILNVLWRVWHTTDTDVVLATDRPFLVLPIAALFCAARGVPLLVDAREGMPSGSPTSSLGQRARTWVARGIYRLTMRYARRSFVQNTCIHNSLAANGVAAKKIIATSAGCDTHLLHPSGDAAEINTSATRPGPIVVYAGHMSSDAGLESVVDIAAAMQPVSLNVAFLFYGDGPRRGRLEAHALKLGVLNKKVWVLDPVPRIKLPHVLTPATVIIGRDQDESAPDPSGHVLDALAAERPVIFPGNNPHRDLVVSRGAGIALPSNDTQAAARELSDFLNDADGLRRAAQQAAALAAGRINTGRVAADIRGAIESAVDEAPRTAVMRRRMLRTKRIMDIVFSLGALTALSSILIGIAIAIRIKMGAPVIFSQKRPGLKGNLFRIYKFRTMTDAMDASGAALPDSDRLTPLGRFMRRTSIDELPELFNVLKGEMSFVGPRPLLHEYLPYYSPEQRRRHDVLPGITGWAQVSGRNALTWEEKFTLDVWYVDNMRLWLDAKILLKTVWVALRGEGVNAPGYSTMPRFDEIMARREGAEDV